MSPFWSCPSPAWLLGPTFPSALQVNRSLGIAETNDTEPAKEVGPNATTVSFSTFACLPSFYILNCVPKPCFKNQVNSDLSIHPSPPGTFPPLFYMELVKPPTLPGSCIPDPTLNPPLLSKLGRKMLFWFCFLCLTLSLGIE